MVADPGQRVLGASARNRGLGTDPLMDVGNLGIAYGSISRPRAVLYARRDVTELQAIPVIVIDEHEIPAEHQFEAFHEWNAPFVDTSPIGDVGEFSSSSIDYRVDDVLLGRLRYGPQTLRRTHKHLGDGTTEWIAMQIHHRGGMRGKVGNDTSVDMNSDTIGVVDYSETYTLVSDNSDTTSIFVPREHVKQADSLGSAGVLDRYSPRGRVFESAVTGLWRRLAGSATADEAGDLAGSIVETINTILHPDDFTPTDRDLGLAMQDHIKANLGDLDLGVDSLPGLFHCSRATVYRLFGEHGGVAAYIRDQRLLRCFEELARPAKLPRRISEVANRWGFENPSHFNRIFKAKFGIPPSQIVASVRPQSAYLAHAGVHEQMVEFHDWIGAR